MNHDCSTWTTLGALCDSRVIQLTSGPNWTRLLAGPEAHEQAAAHFNPSPDAVPLLSPGAIGVLGVISPDPAQQLIPETAARPELTPYRLRRGDVLLARQGALGRTALVSEAEEGWFYNAALYRLRLDLDEARLREIELLPEYLHLHLGRPAVREWMVGRAVGQTVRTLTMKQLSLLEIPLPPLPEQMRVWDQVSSIDRQLARHQRALELLVELRTATIN
jgi:hypothetical protein